MDVTQEVRQSVIKYGGSGNSIASGTSSCKSLNFAEGGNINKAVKTGTITRLPFKIQFKGTTGLFGSENTFVEITTAVKDLFFDSEVETGSYVNATITRIDDSTTYYEGGFIDPNTDNIVINQFEPGLVTGDFLGGIAKPMFSLRMENRGSGNKYEDCWLDVRLYTKQKEEHPYDAMFLHPDDKLYVGFHARNTRRLNYDVDLILGERIESEYTLNKDQRALVPRITQ